MTDYFDEREDWEDRGERDDEGDELEYWLSNCGYSHHRDGYYCTNGGSEECEFRCPFNPSRMHTKDEIS